MWDVEHLTDGQEITEGKQFSGHAATILDVIFSPDGERLAPASFDNTVKVWEVATGRELLTLRGHEGTVDSVAFSPDGQRLASTSWDKTILVYALGLEELIALARSHVTRSLTDKECRQYLHLDACPVNSNS